MGVLVLGGAGYIGSHTVRRLISAGKRVIVLDSLETGHTAAVDSKARFIKGDIRDTFLLDNIFESEEIDAVIHFAANSQVGESVSNPVKYYDNNVGGAVSLVKSMAKYGVNNIVFSSTPQPTASLKGYYFRERPHLPQIPTAKQSSPWKSFSGGRMAPTA